jgi:hypothetical protein
MSVHTPGPWEIDRPARVVWGGPVPRMVICHSPHENNGAHVAANIRLIAAAPDLLDALQAMFDERGRDPQKVVAMCKAAISKATGESNA